MHLTIKLVVCDTSNFDINPIPTKYSASIANTKTDTDIFNL